MNNRDDIPAWFREYQAYLLHIRRGRNWANLVCATAILAIVVAAVALVVAGFGYSYGVRNAAQAVYAGSGPLYPSPFQHVLNAAGTALAMTLPNDLSEYVGRTYTIYSATAQPHSVSIVSGTLVTTWDGTHTHAQLGGAPGDGLTFTVVTKNVIALGAIQNVVFS